LRVHAIVNAANKYGLGCFVYSHKCIDNIIHCKAGPLLRKECQEIMKNKGTIQTGDAIVTKAYKLPCKYIIHVVGPIYKEDIDPIKNLEKCYETCLEKCKINKCHSIAFCCVSTGIFGFPKKLASKIAIRTVREWTKKNEYHLHVIFNVYSKIDYIR
jgi:O-acetyl-ADP-ribose deacetylase (regulator of RNase III)